MYCRRTSLTSQTRARPTSSRHDQGARARHESIWDILAVKYPRLRTVMKDSVETGRMHTSDEAAASPLQGWGLAVLRSSLNLTIFLGIILYVVFIWIWEAPDYEWFYGHLASGDVNIEYKTGDEKGTALLSGYDIALVVYQWLPVLVGCWCVALLHALPKMTEARSSLSARLSLRARAFMQWEAPLHRFWVHWCGGLSTADLLVVLVYLAVHATWLGWLVSSAKDRFAAMDEVGLDYPHPMPLIWLERYALFFGVLLWPTLMLLFFPVAHISFLSDFLGVHYASMIRWHRWIGHGSMYIVGIHGVLYYAYWGLINDFWAYFIDWSHMYSINNFAGSLAWFFGLALQITSIQWVRRNFFEVFYRFHLACFVPFVIFSTIHYSYAWSWWLPGLLVYAIDVVLRSGQALNATTIVAYPAENDTYTTVEVEFTKDTTVRPNEELYLLIPQISHWQWHPFTVCNVLPSASGNPKAILHVKIYNAWTSELFRRSKQDNKLAARVAGPIGRCRDMGHWAQYESVVLVGGGIGALPVIAILNDIRQAALKYSTSGSKHPDMLPPGLKKVSFIWVSRHGSEFSCLDDDMLQFLKNCEWLDISFHITSDPNPPKPNYADKVDPKWLPLTHHWASPLKLSPERPAQPRIGSGHHKLVGVALEILVATLVFVGGFFGTVLGYAYSADGTYSGLSEYHGFYWRVAVIQLACQTVMALGLPYALVILPVTLYDAWRDRLARKKKLFEPAGALEAKGSGSNEGLEVLQSFVSQMTTVQYGRPAIYSMVSKAIGTGTDNVGVFCGGPETMRAAVNNASYAMRQKCNLFGRLVHYYDESHEL